MRAAPLSAEGRWTELVELTERWAAADPRDAEPLRFRGEAMQKLDRPDAAVDAYTEAVALGPDVPSAWYGLALAYAAAGNAAASERAESRLADLDGDLAAQLHDGHRAAGHLAMNPQRSLVRSAALAVAVVRLPRHLRRRRPIQTSSRSPRNGSSLTTICATLTDRRRWNTRTRNGDRSKLRSTIRRG